MAAGSRLCFTLIIVLLLPMLASSYRPFKVPKNLFVHGTSPFTLPEGAHEIIRREDGAPSLETPKELVEDLRGQLRSRVRRDSSGSLKPEKVTQSLAKGFDTLYMYWPRNSFNESNIFLLAKNTKPGSDKTTSKVYVSRNYGKNFTDLDLTDKKSPPPIDQIYSSKADPQLCILADKVNKILYRSDDLVKFPRKSVQFVPSFITFHPRDSKYAMAYDSSSEMLYWSNDTGKFFYPVDGKIKSFHWGVEDIHSPDTVFVEKYRQDRDSAKNNKTAIYRLVNGNAQKRSIADSVEEFEVMKNYMFITTRKNPSDKNPILKVAKLAKDKPISFKTAQFPLNEESRDFFVFDVVDDFVFIVINHLRNLSNMYISDTMGLKYQLSLPRVLYHNPYTDVSSPWLRTVIPYAFVDVDKIKGMRGIYVATQLTPGPVGKRHLLTLITYNRGGKWQRVRSPTVDNRGARINCYLPSCSIHLNLLYGAVYRVSPSERMFSSESAPGLVLALGVASTNLKIYPDVFMSLDGGLGWSRVLRGKHQFTFGDHGGVIVAVPFRRYTRTLRYTSDGGLNWKPFTFSDSSILAQDVVTQPGERLPIFLIYGTNGQGRPWKVFYVNMTAVLGPKCNSTDYTQWTDGCLLGRQQQFETRNWTIQCHMTRNYSRPKIVKNCECTRDDFQCDYGFQRKSVDEECTPIRLGDDLNHNTVPPDCPEGSFYNKTRGFRKIPGDTCENGTEKNFMPVLTSCPVKELANLTLKCSNLNKDGIAAIVTGQTASFSAAVGKGYMPNINFKWFFGDGHDGLANNYTNVQHKYDKPGKYVVSVVASNTRSTIVERIDLYVQDKLNEKQMFVTYHPKNPGVNEAVILSARLNYSSNEQIGSVKYKWKYDDKEINSWQPVATLQFKSSKTYTVSVTAKNYVSKVKKMVQVNVTKDLTPINVVTKVLGSSRILVKWDAPVNADSSIKGYEVYKSTSAGDNYKQTTCESQSGFSCTVGSLTPATTYYFKVKAKTAGSTGPFSIFAAATTNTIIPGMPLELKASSINSAVIIVTWKPPKNANGQMTNYTIQYWSAADPGNVQNTNVGHTLSKNFTGLMQDTYYFFEVYAQTSAGRSIAAGPVQALTKLSKPTQPPRDLKKVSDNGTCALLMWKAPQLSKAGDQVFPAQGYKVQVNDSSFEYAVSAFKIVCNLNPGNIYTVYVWAYSKLGDGPKASISFSAQIIEPGVPQNFRCSTPTGPDRITLAWDPVQSSPGLSYEIYEESLLVKKPLDIKKDKRSYTVSSLLPYTIYKFSISAKNNVGSSKRSQAITCRTSESVPGIVENVATETIYPPSATIRITWSAPDKPNGVINGYKITWGKVLHPSQTEEITVDGSTHDYIFKNLFSSTAYTFIVKAKNSAGEAMQYQKPSVKRTLRALKGTERLQLEFEGAIMDSNDIKSFIPEFIKAASKTAGISDRYLAAVVVKGFKVQFDLIPHFNTTTGVGLEESKSALNKGFKASDWTLSRGSLQLAHDGTNNYVPTQSTEYKPGNTPAAGAHKGEKSGSSDRSAKKTYLAIAVPLALLGLVLLGGVIFYYMKYKSLQKHYSQMGDQFHEDDEMKVVYHGEMEADSPDVIFSDRSRKGKKIYKDSEKVPLGDQDELSMI